MLTPNESYHAVLQQVLSKGKDMPVSRGQAHGTREIFARDMAMHFDLTKGLPVITTKMVWLHGVLHELIWFLSGDTNIKYLLENKVNIWNDNAYDHYCKLTIEKIWSKEVFLDRTIHDQMYVDKDWIARSYGDLGPVYGAQWKEQLPGVIEAIKTAPGSRQILLNTWNADAIKHMALPPCHSVPLHFRVDGDFLDAFMYQRSADLFLGVPFNITSTALLVAIIAQLTGKRPRYITHQLGSAHIYNNHFFQIQEQLSRDVNKYESSIPVSINPDATLDTLKVTDVKIDPFKSYPAIKAEMVV